MVDSYLVAQNPAVEEESQRQGALSGIRCASERMLCYLLKMSVLLVDTAVIEEIESMGNDRLLSLLKSSGMMLSTEDFGALRMRVNNRPRLSIVVASRIDDFTLHSTKRLMVMLKVVAYGCPHVFHLLGDNSTSTLTSDTVYRATYIDLRVDINKALSIPTDLLIEELLSSTGQQEYEAKSPFGTDSICQHDVLTNGNSSSSSSPSDLYWLGSGDFILFHRDALKLVPGYPNVLQHNLIDDTLHCRFLRKGFKQVLLHPPCLNIHMHHRRDSDYLSGVGLWSLDATGWDDMCNDPFKPLLGEYYPKSDWLFTRHAFHEQHVQF
ncbi:hypothetical protein FOL47_004585 [Perkinsus chesapeaki]|uniref:Uncharacterized protein n=1 Tax=Perkinsus chesapeaki TaxID=330153 RepID=A0A7J6MZ20_PERCH|nr:hypothetical protein FOL47_004585 [Perkinsus chesapeaki]